jgi:hypothetical protein
MAGPVGWTFEPMDEATGILSVRVANAAQTRVLMKVAFMAVSSLQRRIAAPLVSADAAWRKWRDPLQPRDGADADAVSLGDQA